MATNTPSANAIIADILKPLGYQSAYYGKWHLGHQAKFLPTNQGFDEYYCEKGRFGRLDQSIPRALDWLKKNKEQNQIDTE